MALSLSVRWPLPLRVIEVAFSRISVVLPDEFSLIVPELLTLPPSVRLLLSSMMILPALAPVPVPSSSWKPPELISRVVPEPSWTLWTSTNAVLVTVNDPATVSSASSVVAGGLPVLQFEPVCQRPFVGVFQLTLAMDIS